MWNGPPIDPATRAARDLKAARKALRAEQAAHDATRNRLRRALMENAALRDVVGDLAGQQHVGRRLFDKIGAALRGRR